MAKTKKMAFGGMGGAAKAAMQSVKPGMVKPGMPAIPSRGNIATQTPQSMPIPPRGQQANMPPPQVMPAMGALKSAMSNPQMMQNVGNTIAGVGSQIGAGLANSLGNSSGMGNKIGSFLPKNAAMPPRGMPAMPPSSSGLAGMVGMGGVAGMPGKPGTAAPNPGLMGNAPAPQSSFSMMKKGGMVSSKPKASSASSRGDGIATKGKTKGRFV